MPLSRRSFARVRGAALVGPFAGDPDSERLGALYLESVGDEANVDALLDAVWGSWSEAQRNADADAVWETLRQQHRADMGAGRTLFLGGWLLSLSEARVHALAALL